MFSHWSGTWPLPVSLAHPQRSNVVQRVGSHLAVHFLKDFKLSGLIGSIEGVVAPVPVGHDAPALEGGLLTGDGLLGELPGCGRKIQTVSGPWTRVQQLLVSVLPDLSVWSAVDSARWCPAPQEPSAQWAGRGSPSRGRSGPAGPAASRTGYGCPWWSAWSRTRSVG